MGQKSQESGRKYWAARLSIRSFARTAHFAHFLARGTENDCMAILSVFFSIFDHSVRLDKKIFARLPLIEFGELEKFSR